MKARPNRRTIRPMGFFRDIAYMTGLVVIGPILAVRMVRAGKHKTDWAGRLGKAPKADPADKRPCLMIHAVSVGEVNALPTLVEQIKASGNDWRIVISTTTDTGTKRAKQIFEPDHQVVRYPFDFTFACNRVLDAVRPDVVALVELEVWPNFTECCERRGIPVVVINGRLSARSFKRYKAFRGLVKPTFAAIAHSAVQTQDYADRFIAMGADPKHVTVTDTMKWDTAKIESSVEGADELAAELGIDRSKPVIVCGSTAENEEKMLIEACPREAQLVMVPRKPERFKEVAQLMGRYGKVVRRTDHPAGSHRPIDDTRLFLIDTMGELKKAYAIADVVIIGRSFFGLHGSNLNESIALGKPTIIGPDHSDFKEAVDAFKAAEGGIVSERPGETAAQLLADRDRAKAMGEAGQAVIRARQGATARHVSLLVDIMQGSRGAKSSA